MNKYKQFIIETGQQLRYASWLYHKELIGDSGKLLDEFYG